MSHLTTAKLACRRTEDQWQSAIIRNRAVAAISDLGGAIQIYKGRYFWPMVPDHPANDFDIETVAHALATMPRWGGQTADKNGNPLRYSVAQHSVHVADISSLNREKIVPDWDWSDRRSPAAYGQTHDAPEGYGFADLVRPVKYSFDGYKEGENRLMDKFITEFDIPMNDGIAECVRTIDNMMIFLERDELVGQPVVPYSNEKDHPGITIHDVVPDFYVWDALEAKERFLQRWQQIKDTEGNYVPTEYRGGGYHL